MKNDPADDIQLGRVIRELCSSHQPDILSDDEIADLHRTVRRPRRDTDAELAEAIEGAWRTRFGTPTVVAAVEIANIRRRGGS